MHTHVSSYYFWLDTFCFNQTTYIFLESAGTVQLTAKLNKPLAEDILVQFRYIDYTATGTYVSCV